MVPLQPSKNPCSTLLVSCSGLVLLASLLGGCNSQTSSQPTPPTPAPAATPAPTSPAPAVAEETATSEPQLTVVSLGAIEVGMNFDEVTEALGVPLQTLDGQPLPANVASESCYYVKPPNLSGTELMLNQGEVVRIDLTQDSSIKTAAGIGIGASSADVEAAYPGQVSTQPHKYVPAGQYLIVTPADYPKARIVFETNGTQVTAVRAGRTPEVEYVERCG